MPRRLFPASLIVVLALAASGTGRAQDQRDREFQECPDCPKMVGIPSGTFLMGSPPKESGRFDSEGPQHSVAIKAFALGKYPVTSNDFLPFLKATGYQPLPCNKMLNMGWHSPGHGQAYSPYNGDAPRWPAICLGWDDAEAYIAWLNAKVRLARPAAAARERSLSSAEEAEWEYAARAGTTTARWWGDESARPRQLQWLRQRMGLSPAGRRRQLRAQSLRPLRHAGQCVGMDGRLLAPQLQGRAGGRQRLGRRRVAANMSSAAARGTISRCSSAPPRAAAASPATRIRLFQPHRFRVAPAERATCRDGGQCKVSRGFRLRTISITS